MLCLPNFYRIQNIFSSIVTVRIRNIPPSIVQVCNTLCHIVLGAIASRMFYCIVQFRWGFVFQVHTALFCGCLMNFRRVGAVHEHMFSFFINSVEDFLLELLMGCYTCSVEAVWWWIWSRQPRSSRYLCLFNTLTLELNPPAQCCLTKFFYWEFCFLNRAFC
jgi:hypothetical protein